MPERTRSAPPGRNWLALLGLLLLALCGAGPQAAELIRSYHSDIRVQADAEVVVTETIRVQADGAQIRRGIYRDIPTDYQDRYGNRYRVRLEVLDVQRDGRPEPYLTQRQGNGVRIYVGDQDVYLEPGEYEYRIRYRSNRQLGFFDRHDELYWNVTGNGWDFAIEQASARVLLPAGIPVPSIQVEAYTGPQDANGQDYEAQVEANGDAVFRTTRPLAARAGLTIVVTWPKGHVRAPTETQRIGYFLGDNRDALVGGSGLLLLFGYYLVTWFKVGRDPAPGPLVPRYEPPRAYSPAALRFVRRMGYDHKTFATALVNLAVRGLLRITEEPAGEFVLALSGTPLSPPAPGEKALVTALFGAGAKRGRVALQQSNHNLIDQALKAHRRALKLDLEKTYFLTNAIYLLPGILASGAVLAFTVLALPDDAQRETAGFLVIWLTGWSIAVLFLVRKVITAWRAPRGLGQAVSASLFALPFLAFELFGIGTLAIAGSPALVLTLLGLVAVNYAFYHWLKAPTLLGRRLLDEVAGFQEYLALAEQDELEFKHPPQKTPELFERYLPYALALDVEQAWAARFAAVLVGAQAGEAGYRPGWYQGSNFRHHDLDGLTRAIGAGMGAAIASAATAPGSSSGSGGGGSSGGGGGGGGGGGW